MAIISNKLAKIILFTGVCCSALNIAHADLIGLDRIVAVVDNDVVLESEMRFDMEAVKRQLEARKTSLPPEHVLTQQVLEQLIIRKIQLQLGERMGIKIDDNTLNKTVANVAKRNRMTLQQFKKAVESEGTSYQQAREQIREEMIVTRVRQRLVSNRIQVTDQDVKNFLESDMGKSHTSEEFRLAHILVSIPAQAEPHMIQAAKQQANNLHEQLEAGADFMQMAVSRSAGQRALQGGDLGWSRLAQLPSAFAEAVVELNVSDITKPLRSPGGYHIVKLLDKRSAGVQLIPQAKVRHILIKPNEIRSDEESQQLITKLRNEIIAGADFVEVARANTDDTITAQRGGDLDWVSPGQMTPTFEDVMNNTEVGQMSESFRSQYGWHILQVTDRRQQDMSSELEFNQARQLLRQSKFEEELQNWIREIRSEAFVELKI